MPYHFMLPMPNYAEQFLNSVCLV